MTAATAAPAPSPTAQAPGLLSRTWRVVRLITANPATTLFWPLAILGVIFLMTWTIWLLVMANIDPGEVASTADGIRFNGAVSYIFVYFLVVAVQVVNQTFPLALGFGSTRRAFSFGATVTFALLAAFYATILTIASEIEIATDGWGVHGAFFRNLWVSTDAGIAAQWWIYFCWIAFFAFTGEIFAAVFVRWRAPGLSVAFVALAALVVGAVAVLTFTQGWAPLFEGIVELGTVGVPTVMLGIGVVAAFVGHLLLSRATPRS